jgi:hypothetical protein
VGIFNEFRAASLKLLIGGSMQASGPINNFALNLSRVGLELKGVCDLVKAFTDSIRRRIACKYIKSPVSKSKAKQDPVIFLGILYYLYGLY